MRRPTTTSPTATSARPAPTAARAAAAVLALSALLVTGCGSDDGGLVEDLPTAGDVTGDTSGTAPATPSESATTD